MKYDKEYFEKQFSNYDNKWGNAWGMNWRSYMKFRILSALDETLEYIKSHENCTLLEIGCATGDFTDKYIESISVHQQVIGADISELAVGICTERFRKYKNVMFINMELPNISINNIDCIICMDVLEYFDVEGKRKCLEAMKDALVPGGRIICQISLQKEKENEFREIFESVFEIEAEHFVYGMIWYSCFDQFLVFLVNVFLVGKRWGRVGRLIGTIAYKICSCDKIVAFCFKLNEKFLPKVKSHIVIVGSKRVE